MIGNFVIRLKVDVVFLEFNYILNYVNLAAG